MLKQLLIATALLASTAVSAFEPITLSDEALERVKTFLQRPDFESVEYFDTGTSLVGIAVTTKGYKKMVLYTDDKGEFIMSGPLVSTSTSENLTQRFTDEIEIDLTDVGTELEKLSSISVGEGDNVIYAVVDTNCGYCRKTFNSMKLMHNEDIEGLRVEWIPVAALGGNSAQRAAELLAIDTTQQLTALEKALNREDIAGFINQESSSLDQAKEQVANNDLWMRRMGYNSVPIVISNINGKWDLRHGAPKAPYFQDIVRSLSKESDSKAATTENVGGN